MSATINGRDCEEIRDLLGAYALGALDPDERAMVAAHLTTCPTCRAEVSSYALVVEALGTAAPRETPPPSLRVSIFASANEEEIREAPNPIPLATAAEESDKKLSIWRNHLVQALSAAAILMVIGVGVLAYMLVQSNDERDDAQAAQAQMADYLTSGAKTVAMTELPASTYTNGQGHGTLLTAPGKPMLMVVGGCPPSSDTRTYRVWVALNGKRTPVGTLQISDDWTGWLTVDTPEAITNYDEIGVTMVSNSTQRDDLLVAQL